LYQKINKIKNPWVPMDTSIPTGIRIVGTHDGTGRTRVSYLSNGAGTGIILFVPMDTH